MILDHNQNICWFPIGNPTISNQKYVQLLQQAVANQDNFETTSQVLTIWHEHSLHERIGKGLNAALSFFEVNSFSKRIKNSIQAQDKFFVASQWAKNIVNNELPLVDCEVIPMGVDSDFYKPYKLQMEKPYRFLCVGKTEVRKGHDLLHEMFNQAFNEEDDVELYIAWDNPFLSEAEKKKWVDMYKNTKLGNKIHFIGRQPDLRTQYIGADCCIFPTRAEAICLPALEAMACCKPVIITNYSGQTEFCNKDNAFLVDIQDLEPANDTIWFHGESQWAELGPNQQAQFIEYMRHCYKNRISDNPKGRETAEKLTWKNTTNKILEVLK